MLTVFISLDVSSNGIKENNISKKIFMGFGYNPNLVDYGERLDILNFFSWMKKLQNQFSYDFFIYDASGYYIVNRTPEKKIKELGKNPKSEQILNVLLNEQKRPKRKEIMRNCDLRSKYLKKAIEITQISAKYIDSRTVFEDKDYMKALDESLEFVEKLEIENPGLISKIFPKNYNLASKLYLPLEIAEALYLQEKFQVNTKFGPKSEKFFDEAIFGLTKEKNIPYQSIRCPYGPRKPGYLSDKDVIWTTSSDYFISEILQSDGSYKEFVQQYILSFTKNNEQLDQAVIRIKQKLKLEEVIENVKI